MTKVAVVAAGSYPDDFKLKVQKQTFDGVSWVDDGAPVEIGPGGRTSANITPTARAYVSSDMPIPMRGSLRFSGDLRIVKEGWSLEGWLEYATYENPDSPWPFEAAADFFRYRLEA